MEKQEDKEISQLRKLSKKIVQPGYNKDRLKRIGLDEKIVEGTISGISKERMKRIGSIHSPFG